MVRVGPLHRINAALAIYGPCRAVNDLFTIDMAAVGQVTQDVWPMCWILETKGSAPTFLRTANFTKGDVALSLARFCFFWVYPKDLKKSRKLGSLVLCHLSCFVFCAGLNIRNNAFYLSVCLVFYVQCRGMNKRNNVSLLSVCLLVF